MRTNLHYYYLQMNRIVFQGFLLPAFLCKSEELLYYRPKYAPHELNIALGVCLSVILELFNEELESHHEYIFHLWGCVLISKEFIHVIKKCLHLKRFLCIYRIYLKKAAEIDSLSRGLDLFFLQLSEVLVEGVQHKF